MGLAAIGSVILAVMTPVTLHLFTDAIPKLSRLAVSRAARRLPVMMRQDQEAAWLGDLAALETDVERLRCVAGSWLTSVYFRWPFALEKSHRGLLASRSVVKAQGFIAIYACGRIKAWDTSTDILEWGRAERWCFGVLVVSRKMMYKSMREHLLCMEEDLKARPREYQTKEEAAKDLFLPIAKEMRVFRFLMDHEILDMQV